ncbi:GNAT family N-acetyltransferase [Bacillus sp. 1P06AnD]|uniref:GNAT family N-acetyltransferase n=1 Tax=Bacillus sp. 1P06AnD TaxID=3132208 RepID=UPI0039A05A05
MLKKCTHYTGEMPVFETKRLYLNEINPAILLYLNNPERRVEAQRFFHLERENELDDTFQRYSTFLSDKGVVSCRDWQLIEKETGRLIGYCGYSDWNIDCNQAMLRIEPAADPQVCMDLFCEALCEVLKQGFTSMRLVEIQSEPSPGKDLIWPLIERVLTENQCRMHRNRESIQEGAISQ